MSSALILDNHRLSQSPLPRTAQQLVTDPLSRCLLPRTFNSRYLPLDDLLGSDVPVAKALTALFAPVLDLSDWLEIGTGTFEVDRLSLDRFDAGSGVLLRGTSSSLMISLLLLGFVDIFVEMLPQ